MDDWRDKLKKLGKKMREDAARMAATKPSKKKVIKVEPPKAFKDYSAPTKHVQQPMVEPTRDPDSELPRPRRTLQSIELPSSPQDEDGPTINIGIDFGSSMTKVCARLLSSGDQQGPVHVIHPEGSEDGLWPVVVSEVDGKIWFGGDALKKQGSEATTFSILKICVRCEAGVKLSNPSLSCGHQGVPLDPECRGVFTVNAQPVSAGELVSLYLAWVMGEARKRLPKDLAGSAVPRITYSVAFPMDLIDGSGRGLAHRILYDAWRLLGAITQGATTRDCLAWLSALDEEKRPPIEERVVEPCAEPMALIASYALSPSMPLGLYGVLDIGASMTEVGFFRLAERPGHGGHQVGFYGAGARPFAMNDLDRRIAALMQADKFSGGQEPREYTLENVRSWRESGVFPGIRKTEVLDDLLRDAYSWTAARMRKNYEESLGSAYEKEKREAFWRKKVRVFISGGGSHERDVYEGLGDHPFTDKMAPIPEPDNLKSQIKIDPSRFLVAYGAADSTAVWPKELRPSSVSSWKPEVRRIRDIDDLGMGEPG